MYEARTAINIHIDLHPAIYSYLIDQNMIYQDSRTCNDGIYSCELNLQYLPIIDRNVINISNIVVPLYYYT